MLNINELINEKLISLDLDLNNKTEVLETMANMIYENEKLISSTDESVKDGFVKSLWEREEVFSTAVGYSFGIPHGKCEYVKNACIAYVRLKNEIEWSEEEKVKYVFMIGVSNEKAGNEHLEILIKLSTSILDDDFREKLEKSDSIENTFEIIKEYTSKEREM